MNRHLLARILVCLALFTAAGLIISTVTAQGDKPSKEEERDPSKPKKKERIVVDDEPEKPKTGVGRSDQPKETKTDLDASDLAAAWKQAKQRSVREYLSDVIQPHDRVITKNGQERYVQPVDDYLGKPLSFLGKKKFRNFDPDWKPEPRTWEAVRAELSDVVYFEDWVGKRTDRFLEPLSNPARAPEVPAVQMLRLAETVLTAALRFHESSVEQGKRKGEAFEELGNGLRKRLLDLQIQQLDLLADGNWNDALSMAKRLAGVASEPAEQDRIAKPLVKVIETALGSGGVTPEQMRDIQERLRQIELQFPGSGTVKPIQDRLRQQATSLYERAMQLREKDPKQAVELFKQAEFIWPRLAGLQDARLTLENAYPVLRVGVRELPEMMAPGYARTDEERLAVDLLFEGLLKATRGSAGLRYEPALADGAPRLLPLGRQFQISPNAWWSNNRPVTADDVRHTVRLLKTPKWRGYDPSLGQLLDDIQISGDATRVSVTLYQGFVDPLSLMTFKVVPRAPWADQEQSLRAEDGDKFAKAPVGSGPYQYKGPVAGRGGRAAAAFIASPNYGARPGRAGSPSIREIQLVTTPDSQMAQDLKAGVVDVIPDLPTSLVKEVQDRNPNATVLTLPTRRVYFLAVNHRRDMLQNQNLRQALADAIDRKKILDDHFRKGSTSEVHRELTGPFPGGSWACDPALSYNLARAKTFIRKSGLKDVKLQLKYPSDDLRVRPAMEALRDTVRTELEGVVELELKGVPARELRQDVEVSHNYELAYYSYDFPSDAFWLWPLFDPKGLKEGSNYLGYANDGQVLQLFQELNAHRDFRELQKTARTLHGDLFSKMPLIPLWQLDRHIAIAKSIKYVPFDPLLMFADVERWRLEGR